MIPPLKLGPREGKEVTLPLPPITPQPGVGYFLDLSFRLKADAPWGGRFGMQMAMRAGFERVSWFGPGSEETYADHNEARVGRHSATVDEQWTEYSKPQENGNKTDVRWMAVTDKQGVGLLAVGMPLLSVAVGHYTHEDVWNATHSYQLTRRPETHVYLDYRQMGVGGDDSWGALAHEPYPLPAKAYSYRFRLRPFSTTIDGTPDQLAKKPLREQ